MIFNFRFLFIILSLTSLVSNYLVFKSNIFQTVLLHDAAEDLYSFKIDDLKSISFEYPSLAINSIPISTYLSRYYTNEKEYRKAIKLLESSKISNPYNLYSKYFLSRNFVLMGNLQRAQQELKSIFDITPRLESSSVLYLSVLGQLKKEEILKELFPKIQKTENEVIMNYYRINLQLSKKKQ